MNIYRCIFLIIPVYMACYLVHEEQALAEFTNKRSHCQRQANVESSSPDSDELTIEQARIYELSLINRDRSSCKARPVTLDALASEAAEMHADTISVSGVMGHWDLKGRKPPQRFSELGGWDYIAENVSVKLTNCSGQKLHLAAKPRISRAFIERHHRRMMDEKPPFDGHRTNILDSTHTRVGLGFSVASGDNGASRVAMVQEFVNHYGIYDQIAGEYHINDRILLSGKLGRGVKLNFACLYSEPLPRPLTLQQANARYSYTFPNLVSSFFPGKRSLHISENTNRQSFTADIPLDKRNTGPGLYALGLWATLNKSGQPQLIAFRNFIVRGETNWIEPQQVSNTPSSPDLRNGSQIQPHNDPTSATSGATGLPIDPNTIRALQPAGNTFATLSSDNPDYLPETSAEVSTHADNPN